MAVRSTPSRTLPAKKRVSQRSITLLPVLALVGRPNVGKSTLFNRLTGTKDALVADFPGLTRDRMYGFARTGADARPLIVIDTGGVTGDQGELDVLMNRQVELAVEEANVVILLVDAEGRTAADEQIANRIRKTGKPVVLVVNKAEGRVADEVISEFFALGIGDPIAISATRGDRVDQVLNHALEQCPSADADLMLQPQQAGLRIAVLGRPNVGKSTLINRYLGEERLLTLNRPGTTRDSISIPFEFDDRSFVLVDTAGIRRRARVQGMVEKFSVVKALQALEEADAVIVLFDAHEGITEQDISLVGLILDRGRALTVGVNKWDGLTEQQRRAVRDQLDRQLPFLDFVDMHFVSALHGSNIFDLLDSAAVAAAAALSELPTPRLNEILRDAMIAHAPPIVGRGRPKLSYAHQGGKRPPTVVIHGNQTKRLPGTYRRYLINRFRRAFRLRGTPIRLELRTGKNPFEGRRNILTPRQIKSRQRTRNRRNK
jgi:GTP-binding protein